MFEKLLLFSGRGNIFKYSANIAAASQSQTAFAEAQMNNSSLKKRFRFSIFCVLFVILCCWMRTLSHTLMIDDTLIVHDYVVFWPVLYLENVQIRKMIFRFLFSARHRPPPFPSLKVSPFCRDCFGMSNPGLAFKQSLPPCKLLKALRKWKKDFFKNLQRLFEGMQTQHDDSRAEWARKRLNPWELSIIN